MRRAKIPGSGGWTPYLLALVALVLIWMALWGSASLIMILLGLLFSALILLVFPLPTMVFRFGVTPRRPGAGGHLLGRGGGQSPGSTA